jgi:hypothetical protein
VKLYIEMSRGSRSFCADLIVGSPYDGPQGRGAVYIFNGSPQGLRSVASQVVQAADVDSKLSTFGYSLSAGTDLDRNGYAGAWCDVTVTHVSTTG